MKNKHRIIAHRGLSSLYPENTLLAFEKACDYPIHGFEIDVQLTRDKEVVICHDETIDRTSNGSGYIKDMDLSELKKFQFTYSFDHLSDDDLKKTHIPTLEEFFDFFSKRDYICHLELKNNIIEYQGLEEEVIKAIKAYGLEDRIMIVSFNHESIFKCKDIGPGIRSSLAFASPANNIGDYARKNKLEFVNIHYSALNEEIISNCQANNILINLFTIDKKSQLEKYSKYDISDFVCNNIEKLL